MEKPRVDREKCLGCSGCVTICPADAIEFDGKATVVEERCKSCYICVDYCPVGAIMREGENENIRV